jgi:hypothetical protein
MSNHLAVIIIMKNKKEEKIMNPGNFEIVYSVQGRLQAALIESMLKKAGVPAVLASSRNGAYLDICVEREYAFDARNLLNPAIGAGEICVFPEYL